MSDSTATTPPLTQVHGTVILRKKSTSSPGSSTTSSPTTQKCKHPQCEVLVPKTTYACRDHWFTLPKGLRDRIWRGFRGDWAVWLAADREAQLYWGPK